MGVFKDMNKLMQMKAAMAMEKLRKQMALPEREWGWDLG